MKKAVYALLALAVVFSAIAVGVKVKENAGKEGAEQVIRAEVDRQVKMIKSRQPEIFAGKSGKTAEKNYRKVLEQQARVNELLKKEALARGVTVAAKEVDAAIAQIRRTYGSSAKFAADLEKQGLNLEQFKAKVKDQILMSKLAASLAKNLKVTEAEARAFYERNTAAFDNKPFEQVVDLVKQRALQQKQQVKFSTFLEELRKKVGQ